MKRHTTNYKNTFIEIAEDCKNDAGIIPPLKGDKKSIANFQYEMLSEHPYKYDSDEVLFHIHALRKDISESEMKEAEETFFSKGQACFRASPLTKTYGWGVHYDEGGKMALYGRETEAYEKLVEDDAIVKHKAMRNKREKK